MGTIEIGEFTRNPGRPRGGSMFLPSVRTQVQRHAANHHLGKTSGARLAQALIREAVAKILTTKGNVSPLEYVLTQMNDANNDAEFRLECARIAMPFVHSKMPISVEIDGGESEEKAQRMVNNAKLLSGLSTDELLTLTALAQKLAVPDGAESGAGETEEVEASYVLPGQRATEEGAVPQAPGVLQSGENPP